MSQNSLTSEELIGLFPDIEASLIRDVAGPGGESGLALQHLLLLCPDHWIQTILDGCQAKKLMVLLRGLPGSGKSTMAKALTAAGQDSINVATVSADSFFVDPSGRYVYVPSLLEKAHQWAQNKAKLAIKNEANLIVVDNTNLQVISLRPQLFFHLS